MIGTAKIARWTWPLWMYVAVSGVIVYVMAVHIYPYQVPAMPANGRAAAAAGLRSGGRRTRRFAVN